MEDYEDDYEEPSTVAMDVVLAVDPVTITYNARSLGNSIAVEASRQVASKILEDARKRYRPILDEAIRSRVEPMLEECLSAPVQKTNMYGEPTGATTTMRELILSSASKYLTETVNRNGNPGDYNDKTTRVQWLINETIAKELGHKVKSEIEAAVKAATEEARKRVADVIAPLLANLKL